jgi:hypothetical protein
MTGRISHFLMLVAATAAFGCAFVGVPHAAAAPELDPSTPRVASRFSSEARC